MSYKFSTFETKTTTYFTYDYTTQDIERYILTYTVPSRHGDCQYKHTYRFDTLDEFNQKLASVMELVDMYDLPLGNGRGELYGCYWLDGTILRNLVNIW